MSRKSDRGFDTLRAWADKEGMREFIRFCIVGLIATGVDAAIFYTVRCFAPYQVALASGYLISLVFNYFFTVRWTFKARTTVKNAVGVLLAHLFNLFVVRMSLMYIFIHGCSLTDKVAYLPTLAISMFTNFLVVKFVVKRFS